jgi:hypothetical protein
MDRPINTQDERDSEGELYHPEKTFGVWRNAADGSALPYVVDTHTWVRGTDALRDAAEWTGQPGKRALVYHRKTGMIVADYYRDLSGQSCYQLFDARGNVRVSANAHLLTDVWDGSRTIVPVTFVPLESSLGLYWENYTWARNLLVRALKQRGEHVERKERLADLLRRFNLLLCNTNRERPDACAGEIIFDPAVSSYDVQEIQDILITLIPSLWKLGSLEVMCGGRREYWTFERYALSRSGWTIASVDLAETRKARQTVPTVAYVLEHPDGGEPIAVCNLSDLDAGALDILLWSILFEKSPDEPLPKTYAGAAGANWAWLAKAFENVLPKSHDTGSLRGLCDMHPEFFSGGGSLQTTEGVSAADLVRLRVRDHLAHLYSSRWNELLKQARQVLPE